MTSASQIDSRRAFRSRARLLVPAMALGLFVAGVGAILKRSAARPVTVSRVVREINAVALRQPTGGQVGTVRIAASGIDPLTGELRNFTIETRQIRFAARAARVIVDPTTDSFSFHLQDVVLADVPADDDPDAAPGSLIRMPAEIVGPVSYGRDIIPDAGTTTPAAPLPRIAAEQPK